MKHWRNRETRRTVRINVRVRTDDGWIDATVRNLSDRGMGLTSHRPLQRNQFVEIARGRCRVVGRIVWSADAACGLRTQDAVDIAGFLAAPHSTAAQGANDRREWDRSARPAAAVAVPLPEQADAARRLGRVMEFGVILAGIVSTAAIAVGSVLEVLGAPLEQISAALAPS